MSFHVLGLISSNAKANFNLLVLVLWGSVPCLLLFSRQDGKHEFISGGGPQFLWFPNSGKIRSKTT